MHLIPASWSHLHMLVSVFPSVGLLFTLCFYGGAILTQNEAMKRASLFCLGMLGLVIIPTYYSGMGSAVVMAQRPGISANAIELHRFWSWFAMVLMGVTALVAWINLWLARSGRRLTDNGVHLTLGLGLLTMFFMIIIGELGWEVNHGEIFLATPEDGTPQIWSHIHMVLNHFPTIGFVFALFFYIVGIVLNNDVMKRSGLVAFVACAILGASTYVTGASAMWALTSPDKFRDVSQAMINEHRDWALITLFGLAFTGGLAWIELWRYRYLGKFSKVTINTVLVFALVTLAVMAETGHRGGQINHPEIRLATDVFATDPTIQWSPQIELLINNVEYFVPWQTVHFFGYTMVFAVVMMVSLRIFGFWKSIPFSAVHRILPLGVFGVIANVFTGMLMLMADTSRYVNEAGFWPKMFFLPIGAIAVMYFSLSDKLWAVKAGDDAPMPAKWVCALVLVSWTMVIMGGRLLPYLTL